MKNRLKDGYHPTADLYGLGVMPVLFSWMTPELQRERSRYLSELGKVKRMRRPSTGGYWEIP